MTIPQSHILDLWTQAKVARPLYSFFTPMSTQGQLGSWLTYSPTGEVEVFETLEAAKTLAASVTIKLKNFTELFASNKAVQYTIVDDLGIELVVAQFQITDTDSSWVGKEMASSLTGKAVWIKVNNYFKIPDDHPDAPTAFPFHEFKQKKITVTRTQLRTLDKKGSDSSQEYAKKLKWWKKADGTVFKGEGEYFVVIDTGRKTLKTMLPGDQDLGEDPLDKQSEVVTANLAAKNEGFSALLKEFGKVIEEDQYEAFLKNYVDLKDTWIANRPNSTYKTLIAIPVQFFDALAPVDPSQLNASYSLKVTPQDLEQYKKHVSAYFTTVLHPYIEKNNVSLNIPKEINCLTGLIDTIQELDKNMNAAKEAAGQSSNRLINIYFSGPESYSINYVFATFDGDNDALYYDLTKTKIGSNPNFTRPRTLLYLINLVKMATDVKNVSSSGMNWITFLTFYTFNCPEINSQNGEKSQLEISDSIIREAEKKLLPAMTKGQRKSALAEALSPHIKSAIADAKSTMFMKLQDPTIKKLVLNGVGIDSTDKIYDEVLSKLDIHQLIYLSKVALDPSQRSQWFQNKFEIKDLQAKYKMAGNYKDQLENALKMNPKSQVSTMKKLAVTLPDTATVVDITAKASQTAYWSLKNALGDVIKEQVNKMIKEVVDFLRGVKKDNTPQDNFSELALPDMVTPDMLPTLTNSLSSLPNVFAQDLDISLILTIISQNSTPAELLSIFAGHGDLEVIQILQNELTSRIRLLQPSLTDVYRTEDFLMALGKHLLPILKNTTAQKEIEKYTQEAFSSFCVDTAPQVVDYLSERFPNDISTAQINRNKIEKEQFLSFLGEFEDAINNNAQGFLFDEDISSLLDFENSDPSNASMIEMSLNAYFQPVVGIFEMESMNAGAFFLETKLVDQDAGTTSVAYQYTGQEDIPEGVSNKKIVHDIKVELEAVKNGLKNKDNFSWVRTLKGEGASAPYDRYIYVMPNGASIKLDFYLMEQYTFGNPSPDGTTTTLQPPYFYKNPIDIPDKEKYFVKITYTNISGETIIDFVRELPVSKEVSELVQSSDFGISPQASAYGTFVKDIIEKEMDKYGNEYSWRTDDGWVPGGKKEQYNNFCKEIKDFLFSYQNERLIEFIALKIANGPFFKKSTLQKLRIDTPSHGTAQAFEDSDAPASSQLAGEESGKPNKNLDKFLDIDKIMERVKKKRKFFEILEKKQGGKLNGRSAMENSLVMESIELFFKAYVLETLLSGMPVYGDIDTATIASYEGNYEINKNIMVKQIGSLGDDFKYEFYSVILEYATYRSYITREDAYFKPLPENLELDNIDQIMSFLMKEQFLDCLPLFRKKAQMALGDPKLQPNEFLDFIPNILPAPSSVYAVFDGDELRLTDPNNEEKSFIAENGGFVLEKYIKMTPGNLFNNGNETMLDKLRELTLTKPQQTVTQYASSQDVGGYAQVGHTFNAQEGETAFNNLTAQTFLTWLSANPQLIPAHMLQQSKNFTSLHGFLLQRWKDDGNNFLKQIPMAAEILKNSESEANIYPVGETAFFTYPSLNGVVQPNAFASFQKEVTEYNNDVLSSTEKTIAKLQASSQLISGVQAIRQEAADKWTEAAMRLDMWYSAYKDAVKLTVPSAPKIWDSKYPAIEYDNDEKKYIARDDIKAIATDSKLWTEWSGLDTALAGNRSAYDNSKIAKALAEAGNDDQKVMKELAVSVGMGMYDYVQYATSQGLEDFLKSLDVGGAIQDIIDNPQDNINLNSINTSMEDFLFGLEKGLEYYDLLIKDAQELIDAGDGHYWYGDDYTEVNNFKKRDDAQLSKNQLIIRKNMLDIGFPINSEDPKNTPIDEYISLKKILESYNTALEALQEAEVALNSAEAGVTSIYNSFVTGDANVVSYKVVDLDDFTSGAIAEAKQKLSDLRATAFVQPYEHYLSELKYGIRLVYYFPQKDDLIDPISNFPLAGQERLNDMKEMWRTITPPPWSPVNYRNKLFNVKEIKFLSNENYAGTALGFYQDTQITNFHAMSLLEMEEDVHSYLGNPMVHMDDSKIMAKFDEVIVELKKRLLNTSEYKMLMSEIMYYPELVNALGLYCSVMVTDNIFASSDLGLYSGTKFNLKQIIQSVIKEQGVTFMDPESKSIEKLKNSFSNIRNPTKDPSPTGEVFTDAIGAAAIMASKTALQILKGVVETTDPAIIMGKKYQKGIVAAMTTTKKVGETVGSVVVASEKVINSDSEQEGDSNLKKENDKILKGFDDAIKVASSEAALTGIVFSPLCSPFPLYPIPFSVITPAGIAYLAAATIEEVSEEL